MSQRGAWDVIVIGAGPAGAVAAQQLASHGRRVLLVDKARFPRPKVCGCCINHHAVTTLDRLGLGDAVRARNPAWSDRFELTANQTTATLPIPTGMVMTRADFDHTLTQQAQQSGACFEEGTTARIEPMRSRREPRDVLLDSGQQTRRVSGRMVIAADGLAGTSLKQLPAMTWRVEQQAPVGVAGTTAGTDSANGPPGRTIAMAVARGGYIGRVQLPDGTVDIAGALQPDAIKQAGGRDALIQRIMTEAHGQAGNAFEPATITWQGTPPLRRSRPAADHRLLIVGDAAGYVEPFTGEGIGWAIDSGAAAAQLTKKALQAGAAKELARLWQRRYRRPVTWQQGWCRGITWALRHPGVTRAAVRVCRAVPSLARPIIRYTAERAAKGGLQGSLS